MSGGVVRRIGPVARLSCPLALTISLASLPAIGIAQPGRPGRPSRAPARHPRGVARPSAGPRVLRVGTYRGQPGPYARIQAAADAARPGDWILVAPGDYHERADHRANRGPQPDKAPAGVVLSTPGVHLRGLHRNRVVVDGTLPGSPSCTADPRAQDLGPKGSDGNALGRNGVLVWQANGVSVENLTVCNFLNGAGKAGNELWFNGGDGSGQLGALTGFSGAYLTATSSYYRDPGTAAAYGLFSSNATDGVWDQTYASNFSDAGYYIGACQQSCRTTIDHAHAQFNALGYSGTNAGGELVIENSEFDQNRDGVDTNSQNNDDAPPPQDGACPAQTVSPVTHTSSCWVFQHNYVHDNNNPNVPGAGVSSNGPTGTGMSISGGRNNTIRDNRFENNGAWGVILVPYPDTATPPDVAHCQGGINFGPPSNLCLFDDWGNEVAGNTFRHNGFFGNDTNGDLGEITITGPNATNCFHGNVEAGGGPVSSSPAALQASKPTCTGSALPDANVSMLSQIACDTQFLGPTPCLGGSYPTASGVVPHPPGNDLPTMPAPCAGVPPNPWCRPPTVSALRVTPRRWRVGAPGTVISFTMSAPGSVRLSFWRVTGDQRRVVGTLTRRRGAGRARLRFRGHFSRRRALAPGRYVATVTATARDGSRSAPVTASFRVL